MNICAFCELEKPLLKSHVMPRWSWKELKNDGNSLSLETSAILKDKDGKMQFAEPSSNDDWERLFCSQCEQLMGDNESYLKLFTINKQDKMRESLSLEVFLARDIIRGEEVNIFVIENITSKLKKSLAGLALKAHYAEQYKDFKLKDRQLTSIKKMINDEDDNSLKIFRAVKNFTLDDNKPNPLKRHSISQQENVIHIDIAGWNFLLAFSLPDALLKTIPPENILPVNLSFMTDKGASEKIPFKEIDNLPDEYDCICGSKKEIQYCCRSFWFKQDIKVKKNSILENQNIHLSKKYTHQPENKKSFVSIDPKEVPQLNKLSQKAHLEQKIMNIGIQNGWTLFAVEKDSVIFYGFQDNRYFYSIFRTLFKNTLTLLEKTNPKIEKLETNSEIEIAWQGNEIAHIFIRSKNALKINDILDKQRILFRKRKDSSV
jgi:hypothetical protein